MEGMFMNGSSNWISVADTAILLKVRPATIIRQIEKGTLPARTPEEMPFTYDGKPNFEVLLDALPQHLQYQYLYTHLPKQDICSVDLVSPRSALGNVWLNEFLDIASLIQDATIIQQNHHSTGKTADKLRSLAGKHGVSLATLYRLIGKPSSIAISALYTDPYYLRNHLPRTMCLWSCDLAFALFLDSSVGYSQNDILSELETLNQLAEVATRELSQQEQPVGFKANKRVAQVGGSVAGNARKDLEQRLGRPIITSQMHFNLIMWSRK